MSKTIEHAGKAIFAKIKELAKKPWQPGKTSYCPDYARAVIIFMREPPENVVEIGVKSICKGCDITYEECLILWHAMIDKMLKD